MLKPHKNVLEDFRFDSPLKWLVQSSAEDAQSLPQAQAKGVLHPQRGTRCPWRCCGWRGQGLLREGENSKQEKEMQLPGVSWLCSSSCSSPWLQSFGSGSKTCFASVAAKQSSNWTETHLPECHSGCSSERAGGEMCHCTKIPLRRPGGSLLCKHSPQGILQPSGFFPFQAEGIFYLIPFKSKRHQDKTSSAPTQTSVHNLSSNHSSLPKAENAGSRM